MKLRYVVVCVSLLICFGCGGGSDTSGDLATNATLASEDIFFTVNLPGVDGLPDDSIEIPAGRPVYAIFVSGYLRNKEFDGLHFYNFAKALQAQGAYVHYAWWNNLLAPYMERPLHDPDSSPGSMDLSDKDYLGLLPKFDFFDFLDEKANPGEDYQFQADAEALLQAIRDNNPHAAIIVVGHSFGGDSVARLGAATSVDIDILAPIDPVGNRSCTENNPICNNPLEQWTRFRATHEDYYSIIPLTAQKSMGANIKYLYHRWQNEALPPTDFFCGSTVPDLLDLCLFNDSEYLFLHPDTHVTSIQDGSTNVQSPVVTSLNSYPPDPPLGLIDGHGEIVGYRGFDFDAMESFPLAIRAQNWPAKTDAEARMTLLQNWESDSNYLDNENHAPTNPELCMVSPDLISIFQTAVNLQPIADAGPDQSVECGSPDGTPVTLNGSGSSDPNGDPLVYTWTGPFGTQTGETITPLFPLGVHEVTLTVEDPGGKTGTDTVEISVSDTEPPLLSVSLSPDRLWPPMHKLVTVNAMIETSDTCDANPTVELVSILSSEADNGLGDGNTINDIQEADIGTDDREFLLRSERSGLYPGRVYTIVYESGDASGNKTEETIEVTAPHDNRSSSR